jgi:hypothetical protein
VLDVEGAALEKAQPARTQQEREPVGAREH